MYKNLKLNYSLNDINNIKNIYNLNDYSKKIARSYVYDYFINNDIPNTFSNKIQVIENPEIFQNESYQLFIYLLNKFNNFSDLVNLKENEYIDIIQYMTPGKDKPIHMVYWNKCVIASLFCGCAPTKEQYYSNNYHQIINSIIDKKIISLLYLLLLEIRKYGDFILIKGSFEDTNKISKNGKSYYIHYIRIIKNPDNLVNLENSINNYDNLNTDELLNLYNKSLIEQDYNNDYINNLNNKIYELKSLISDIKNPSNE